MGGKAEVWWLWTHRDLYQINIRVVSDFCKHVVEMHRLHDELIFDGRRQKNLVVVDVPIPAHLCSIKWLTVE